MSTKSPSTPFKSHEFPLQTHPKSHGNSQVQRDSERSRSQRQRGRCRVEPLGATLPEPRGHVLQIDTDGAPKKTQITMVKNSLITINYGR
jgi:hypothetical protein